MAYNIDKVGKYHLSDLQWYIIRKYPGIRGSYYYKIQEDMFLEMVEGYDEEEVSFRIKVGIENCVKEDLELQKQNMKDDPRRMEVAACCLVMIDAVA